MKKFLNEINYSSVNEDALSEIRALGIKSTDRVLCITGSGARTLDLLIQNPREIVSIDINPAQNYLLELKMTAIKNLDYDIFLSFLGLTGSENRERIYEQLRFYLSDEAKLFWDKNIRLIKKGIFYRGNWERYFRLLAAYLKFTRKTLLKRLFGCNSPEEQFRLWSDRWNNLVWKMFLRTVSSRLCWKYLLRDPGFYRYVPRDFSIYNYIKEKFDFAAKKILFKQSPFLTLLFTGKINYRITLPPHLQKSNYEFLKSAIDHVRIVTGSLDYYLAKDQTEIFDCYSLSDIASYTDMDHYKIIWSGIINSSSAGARVCERQFLVKRNLDLQVFANVKRNYEIENELTASDNSAFYSFQCATIK